MAPFFGCIASKKYRAKKNTLLFEVEQKQTEHSMFLTRFEVVLTQEVINVEPPGANTIVVSTPFLLKGVFFKSNMQLKPSRFFLLLFNSASPSFSLVPLQLVFRRQRG